jgi:hypothetical protein
MNFLFMDFSKFYGLAWGPNGGARNNCYYYYGKGSLIMDYFDTGSSKK